MMIAVQGWVSGKVQGVGFRQFTVDTASDHGLVGYVKNLPDGRVEFFLQGERDTVESVLVLLSQGPRWARVSQCDHQPAALVATLNEFELRF